MIPEAFLDDEIVARLIAREREEMEKFLEDNMLDVLIGLEKIIRDLLKL